MRRTRAIAQSKLPPSWGGVVWDLSGEVAGPPRVEFSTIPGIFSLQCVSVKILDHSIADLIE